MNQICKSNYRKKIEIFHNLNFFLNIILSIQEEYNIMSFTLNKQGNLALISVATQVRIFLKKTFIFEGFYDYKWFLFYY